MMHWSNVTQRTVHFKNRKYQGWQRPKCMNSWQDNPISYEQKRLKKFVLLWRFRWTELKRLLQYQEGNITCTWIEPDKLQPNGQMLIGRGQKSNWGTKSIRWYLLNTNFSTNYYNIMRDAYCRKLGPRQPVTEAHQQKHLLRESLQQKKRCTVKFKWPPSRVWNFTCIHLKLRL